MLSISDGLLRSDFGTSPWNVRPVAMAARLRKPLLVIVGGEDTVVPPSEGLAIFNAAPGPKQLLEVPTAGHVQAYYAWAGPIVPVGASGSERRRIPHDAQPL